MTGELGMITMCTIRGGRRNGTWIVGRWDIPLTLLTLELALLLLLVFFFAPGSAQEGFLSIDCGSSINYTDTVTGLPWVTDAGYISEGQNSPEGANKTSTSNDPAQPKDARYFPGPRNRFCYVLQVEPNATYLVRSTFLLSPLTNTIDYSDLTFDVYVNSTYWTTISYGGTLLNFKLYPDQMKTLEMIFRSEGRELYVCLVRRNGVPFISSLALRKLGDDMYPKVREASTALLVFERYNFGVDPKLYGNDVSTRYPDDPYDREWESFGPSVDPAACPSVITNTTAVSSVPQDPSANNRVPAKVMESACVSYNGSITLTLRFPSVLGMYYAALYLQEIQGDGVSPANPRAMSVNAVDIKNVNVTFTSNVTQVNTPPKSLSNTTFLVNITKLASSTLPPIVNAGEFAGEEPLNMSVTGPTDVVAMKELQNGLGLPIPWTGDPCFPEPWNWVTCNSASKPARIAGIDLSYMNLSGSIPASISGLTNLTALELDHNKLSGIIPNLQNLTMLRFLHLQNNNLTGQFPEYLFENSNLAELYVQENALTGQVPKCQKNSSLTYECGGNQVSRCQSGLRSCSSSSNGYSARSVWTIVGSCLAGVAVVTFIISLLVCLLRSRRRKLTLVTNQQRPVKPVRKPQKSMIVGVNEKDRGIAFTFEQVRDATDNFADKIGEGSFGPVYRGKLPGGQEIAVKTNAGYSRQGTAEFVNEVNLLSRVHHKNLVSLLGSCEEKEELILVYDYMANGTLRDHLYSLPEGRRPLSWATRLNIAISAAKGLEYLHTACNPRIIHRDVKSSNILLDDHMIAKVADFGLSKSGADLGFTSGFSTLIKGTPGYFDPEYYVKKKLTQKSDVYSFGIVLLEIISGRPPYPSEVPDGNIRTLLEWMQVTKEKDIFAIVDPTLAGLYNEDSMREVIHLAANCVEQRGHNRPDSFEVVQRLSHARDMEPSASSRARRSMDSNIFNSRFEASGSVNSFSSLLNTNANMSAAYMSTDISYSEGR